ncbi:hypothetical protein D3C84_1300950 [compost metagenome]
MCIRDSIVRLDQALDFRMSIVKHAVARVINFNEIVSLGGVKGVIQIWVFVVV